MKTCLYQPIFINPQAYFVFPQLYHIEKGDSYIEPANITGQLIINNLSEGLTLTPTVNVIQDSNQVDFSLFKDKHIRISQYTNIGAVVLGEWYIPGTPEPEQPDWFKESIVAWYSPYYKQKLTNYDVIEAYVEDFTKWAYCDSRGIAKITNNTIVITNVVETNNIVEDDNKPYSDLTIRVTGVTENKYLIVRQGRGKPEAHIKKDGVYTFKDNNLYFGFGVSVIGECNITITQLPTSILKDFSGNKHDAYLYGFKGKLNSGVGIYAQDFKNWRYGSTINKDISTKSYNKFHIVKKKADNWFGFTIGIPKNNYYNQSYKLKFNINKKIDDIKFSIVSTDGNLITTAVYSVYINDGSIIDVPIISEEIFNNKEETNIYYDFGTNKDIEIDIELIANYPNQLCYDGKSYAITYGLPILTDYTVIADRTWFDEKVDNGIFMSKSLGQNGAFILEYKRVDRWDTYSYYSHTIINVDKTSSVIYQTKNKYNKQIIYPGDKPDTDTLFIGTIRKDDNRTFIGCHRDILLFNRTLTEYEISWVKNNLMCIEQQKPDKDDILKSLIVHYNVSKQGADNIKATNSLTDYSGNNRHATCKNFNWSNTEFVDDGKAIRLNGNGNCIVGIDMPQLDKYTVIVKRRWIDKKSENKWFCSLGSGDYTSASQSLFWFEGGLLNNVFYTYNRGYKNPIVLPELISIQSSDDYNGLHINESNAVQVGNKLFIGSVGENDNTHVTADFYQLLLFDRVLTDKEREWVKENLIEPDIISASKACSALFEPENLEITDEFPNGVIRDSLGGEYYLLPHSSDYTIENGLMKSTDDTFLISIENANENDVKAMIIDMYYDSTVPGSYLNGEYTEGSVKLTNRRIMGINNPTTTSIFQDLMQVLETGFTIGKIALYNKELNKDEFDSEAFHKGFAVRHSTFEKDATTHLFRDGHKELTPGEYLLPFETLYLRVDVPEGYAMQDYVFDEIEQSWKPNTPKSYICPEHDFHIIAMGEQMKVIKNWSPLASISTFGFKATDNQVEFVGSTDGGTMSYILDDTDVTKFTIEYTNTAGEGNVYLMIGDRQYDVISGQPQTYSVSGSVKLEFLNMEEINNFAGTIKFTNVN